MTRGLFVGTVIVMLASHFAINLAKKSEKKVLQKCKDGDVKYDSCARRCACDAAGHWHCCRVRRDFTRMNSKERKRYINTFLIGTTHPLFKQKYDALVIEHQNLFNADIHYKKFFLPWHRGFILRFENLFRTIDCRFTIPYWDWAADEKPWEGLPWGTGEHEDSPSRLGPNGTGRDKCVTHGPFRNTAWFLNPSAGYGCLKRHFHGTPPDLVALFLLLSKTPGEFDDFEFIIRHCFHNHVHCLMNGTMCTSSTANAPEFLLHHGFLDKIWYDWQRKGVAYKYAYYPTINEYMTGATQMPIELLDLHNQPGGVCVTYQETVDPNYQKLKHMSVKDLKRICNRRAVSRVGLEALKLFNVLASDIPRIRREERNMKGELPCSLTL